VRGRYFKPLQRVLGVGCLTFNLELDEGNVVPARHQSNFLETCEAVKQHFCKDSNIKGIGWSGKVKGGI